ncbi:SPOR domain-containing protein [Sedimenticola thiotaurini]|uniref:SPOR domain-containing protein n=1 Tax=Sedimenticola thiotaurini TaxID=1543721 RepID=A0A0F7JYD4_9GAMM|nr:SPOR domain-containing protein [Sedimenticola thiotaurini]AKH21401.1 hypothetical protein AAY24_14725 [Sedimenticola thiotaurini]
MKWLFILLLLTNLAILGWGLQRDPDRAMATTKVSRDIGDLQLLSEVKAEQPNPIVEEKTVDPQPGLAPKQDLAAIPAPEKSLDVPVVDSKADAAVSQSSDRKEPTEPPPPVCGAFGPFERGAEARAIAESLVGQGMDASLRRESMEKPIGFWVLIPPLSSQQAAIEKVKQLRASGIEDIRRFVKGDLKDGISLGVFSNKSNAQKRQQEVANKGHRADVVPRLITVPSYWIDYRSDQSGVERAEARLRESEGEIKNEQYPCSRVVTSGGIF